MDRRLRMGRRPAVEDRGAARKGIAPARFELASQAPKARRLDRYPTGLARTKGGELLKDSRRPLFDHFTRPIPAMSSSDGGARPAGSAARHRCPPPSSPASHGGVSPGGVAGRTGTRRERFPNPWTRFKRVQDANPPNSGRTV